VFHVNFPTILAYAVITILVCLSAVCFFTPESMSFLQGKNNFLLGGVFLAYAVFRFFRLRATQKRYAELEKEQHEN
jgi:hypothetical protein